MVMSPTADMTTQPTELDIVSHNDGAPSPADEATRETNTSPCILSPWSSATEMPLEESRECENEAANSNLNPATTESEVTVPPVSEAQAENPQSGEQRRVQAEDPVTMSGLILEASEKMAEPETTDAAAVGGRGSEPRESSQKSPDEGASSPLSQAILQANSFSVLFDRVLKEVSQLSREERLARMPWIPKGAEPVGVDHETAMGWIDEITEEHIRSLEEGD